MRTSYAAHMAQTYNGLVSTLTALGRTEEAFNFSERGRARAFLDMLGNRVDLSRGRDSSLIKEEEYLKRKIGELALREQEVGGDVSGELEEAKKQYALFLEKLRKSDLEHASLVSVEPMTLTDLQAMLRPGQTVIEFHVLNNATIAWLITRDHIQSSVIKQSRKALAAKVSDYRESIESITTDERSIRIKSTEKPSSEAKTETYLSGAKVEKRARELYLTLLGGFKIDPGQELIIVPHDILHYLPFHSLVLPDGSFLLEKNPLSYLSSASLMKFTAEKRKKAGSKLLAFGNPDLGNPLYDLKYAEKEVNNIKTIYPESEIYLRKEATRTRAIKLSGNFDIIHFATHGEYDDNDPLASALRLSPAGADDGRLTAEDIFKMKIGASLVVLSACETALGKINRGDEVIGFTRAIIYAGAPSVITTLWQVSDVATYIMMQDFYKNLKSMRKADALRTAQLDLMKNYRHPFFWGAFVLTGDPE
ncbi:MAG: CHAT domain-containing protein [Nitrospirae bacterium]|nr:CHAT domain-containing protein [Nitrospirota bacterium]